MTYCTILNPPHFAGSSPDQVLTRLSVPAKKGNSPSTLLYEGMRALSQLKSAFPSLVTIVLWGCLVTSSMPNLNTGLSVTLYGIPRDPDTLNILLTCVSQQRAWWFTRKRLHSRKLQVPSMFRSFKIHKSTAETHLSVLPVGGVV